MLTPPLQTALRAIMEREERVAITRTNGVTTQVLKGYVVHVPDHGEWFTMAFRSVGLQFHGMRHVSCHYGNRITEVRSLRGKRRKSGMHYPLYYLELEHEQTSDGMLDVTATLKTLLHAA